MEVMHMLPGADAPVAVVGHVNKHTEPQYAQGDSVLQTLSNPASADHSQASSSSFSNSQASPSKHTSQSSPEQSQRQQYTPIFTQSLPDPPCHEGQAFTNGTGQVVTHDETGSQQRHGARPSTFNARQAGTYQVDNIIGQKRTASGAAKPPDPVSPTSPVNGTCHGQSRNTSTTSHGTQLSDLSAQLRTRLTYAKVKVQHGWESRTLEEVEKLASQPGSPLSMRTESQKVLQSPRTSMMNLYQERMGFAQSSERTTLPPSQPMTTTLLPLSTLGGNYIYAPAPQSERRSQPPSFQLVRPSSSHRPQSQHSQASSLAPPVNLTRNLRRFSQPARLLPDSNFRAASTLSASCASAASARSVGYPETPPSRQFQPSLKTPTQKATAMEKDAIETLLFMSSPGASQFPPNVHSGLRFENQPSGAPSGRPQRSAFGTEKRVLFEIDADDVPITPRKKDFLDGVTLGSGGNIDRVLDQMETDSYDSSDDEEGMGATVGGNRLGGRGRT